MPLYVGPRRSLLYAPAVVAAASATTIFTQALNANDPGYGGYTIRTVVPITGGAGTQVRVTFEADTGNSSSLNNASIGISNTATAGDSAGTSDDCGTTATPVELKFSTASGFAISAGQSITSDWANLTGFTSTNLLVVIIDFGGSNANPRLVSGLASVNLGGTARYFQAATASYNSATGAGTGQNGYVTHFNKIEVL